MVKWGSLAEDVVTHVHDGDGLVADAAEILEHVLDEHAALCHLDLWWRWSVCESVVGEVK
jgi:hypothetical protein